MLVTHDPNRPSVAWRFCIAIRYEKTARKFLAIITVAAIVLWLR
jgi:hypothetical protein